MVVLRHWYVTAVFVNMAFGYGNENSIKPFARSAIATLILLITDWQSTEWRLLFERLLRASLNCVANWRSRQITHEHHIYSVSMLSSRGSMIPMQGSYFETRVFLHSLLSQASKSIGFAVYTSNFCQLWVKLYISHCDALSGYRLRRQNSLIYLLWKSYTKCTVGLNTIMCVLQLIKLSSTLLVKFRPQRYRQNRAVADRKWDVFWDAVCIGLAVWRSPLSPVILASHVLPWREIHRETSCNNQWQC